METVLGLQFGRNWSVAASGELLGSTYTWAAESRRELDGVRQGAVPLFRGTFNHAGGTGGEFHLRRKGDELLTLGVLGAPHSIRGLITEPRLLDCAVEVGGIPDVELRLEHRDMYAPTQLDVEDIRAAGDPNCYVGYCLDHSGASAATPPGLAVVTALVLADTLLVREFYLKRADS